MAQVVMTAQSDTPQGVDDLINEHVRRYPDIEITHLSSSSCWDAETKYVVYTTTIVYRHDG